MLVNRINNNDHPVEVGLADSFYIDQGKLSNNCNMSSLPPTVYISGFIRYIFEYSRIRLNATQNLTNSAYIITPVPSACTHLCISLYISVNYSRLHRC